MDNLMRRLECGSESAEEWKSCCLAQFSDFLGMSTTSFEKEILALLKKWKLRKEQKDQWSRSKRIKVESSSWSFLKEEVMGFFKEFLDRGRDGGILCKLDIEKAYDHVNWRFLLWLLEMMGFGANWINWIQWCIAMLGLRVNLDKSELIAKGKVENVKELALEFGCKFSTLLSSYLGLPFGARFKDAAIWDRVEERLRKRLSIWKRQYISK
ncbi:hypothetical protein VitviT2T_002712 [Vitis vinifera]|uniref:Reverse transcriptase domain-containing protein n=1 Tax=Vitis vinifera TaxID=29760 RepID=A0ABY9BJB9_VITVI|nr:hypothetical protein VitviT2T_002712 [Vitis vinifera]